MPSTPNLGKFRLWIDPCLVAETARHFKDTLKSAYDQALNTVLARHAGKDRYRAHCGE